nr:MAG TPA: hypothetical protein [Microviridae sp.]
MSFLHLPGRTRYVPGFVAWSNFRQPREAWLYTS